MTKLNVSVIIITKNEENNIRDCLESVLWADEIIVVDSGSDDGTLTICQEYTHHIYVNNDWKGFGYQKGLALAKATKSWVFSIDADERVTEELRNEIQTIVKADRNVAYAVPRQAFFLGKELRHGDWWPDYVVRLFKRGEGRFSEDIVHEQVLVNVPVKKIATPLIHYSYISLEQLMEKMNKYSSAGAVKAEQQGKRSGLTKAIGKGVWAFANEYFIKGGVMDGSEGLIAAISKGEETYYKYLKLFYLLRH